MSGWKKRACTLRNNLKCHLMNTCSSTFSSFFNSVRVDVHFMMIILPLCFTFFFLRLQVKRNEVKKKKREYNNKICIHTIQSSETTEKQLETKKKSLTSYWLWPGNQVNSLQSGAFVLYKRKRTITHKKLSFPTGNYRLLH